jgi:hypothetical protein
MTAPATYTVIVGDNAAEAAQAAHNARYTQDDARINAEATVTRAKLAGEVVWAVRYLVGQVPTLYVTYAQAARLGYCHCGKPATHVGFEGIRCDRHAKGGMSLLCTTSGCTQVSHTGFSSLCGSCITPEQRAAYERYQDAQRVRAMAPYR